ncbi:hypothetical protein K1T71_001269 [Dendrolimus kikuchii]|uniref:Uncharacterized protein n=1 Tax=Dendrolimus kikuchii TaxID=765133 RepID=A0ACC1DH66_9NEOP|nr:hypothetical protein K1T71_001269 [Dendrolimus kikuchii]
MNFERNRLNTFNNWPSSAPVDPIRIAKAGFYYTGEGTEVQCFSCGGKISDWNYDDQVMLRHRRLNPDCQFVTNSLVSGNVPFILGPRCPSPTNAVTPISMRYDMQDDFIRPSQHIRLTEEDEMYKNGALRLLSFANWEDNSVSRESLVAAGFYHKGEGLVRCAWCGGEIASFRAFSSLGSPLAVHRRYFPWCPHLETMEPWNENNTNVRIGSLLSEILNPPLTDNDTQPQSSGAAHNERLLNMSGTWRSLGVVSGGARHPHYASLSARLASFQRWPADRQQEPQTLAEAGFFHTGIDDQVRCFYCDGGLGKWEAGDTPWSEHARWFPDCGYVLLHKGQEFVDASRKQSSVQRTFSAESGLSSRRRNPGVNFPITDSQVEECMESAIALAALGAGLDAARVKRALSRRLRATGLPFTSSEALIDAVLDEQLNEEAWSVSPQSQRLARDILAETLRDFAPRSGIIPPTQWEERPDSASSNSESPTRPLTPQTQVRHTEPTVNQVKPDSNIADNKEETNNKQEEKDSVTLDRKPLSLEEENRQLKEARLCKVCMDSEVSVVFLPCGHLVSCGGCGSALPACPLCRCAVKALVRAYLA